MAAPLASTGTTAAAEASGARIPGVDGLRAMAAFSIFLSHVWLYSTPDGDRVDLGLGSELVHDLSYGVTLFFALSGFLLFRPFAAALMRGQDRPSLRTYFTNRALRILPAYWVILLVAAFLLRGTALRVGSDMRLGSLDAKSLLQTAFLVQNYDPATLGIGIGPAWSLAVEVAFYLVLPLLSLAAWSAGHGFVSRRARRLTALMPALVMLAIGLSGKAAATWLIAPQGTDPGWDGDWYSVVERSFWCHADLFAFGMVLALVITDWEDGHLRLPRHWRMGALGLAASGYVLTTLRVPSGQQLSASPYDTLMAMCAALVVASVVLVRADDVAPPFLTRMFERRAMVFGGTISYGVFLWHEPLIHFASREGLTLPGRSGLLLNALVLGAVALSLSLLTFRLVEAPALRLKKRLRPTVAPAPVAAVRAA